MHSARNASAMLDGGRPIKNYVKTVKATMGNDCNASAMLADACSPVNKLASEMQPGGIGRNASAILEGGKPVK